jgi:hypothetical protein
LTEIYAGPLFTEFELEDFLLGRPAVAPLVLSDELLKQSYAAVTLTLPGERDYGMPAKGPVQKSGHELCVLIPFTGEPLLWKAHPLGVGYGLIPTGTVDAAQGTLTMRFAHTDDPGTTWYARALQKALERIQININCQADILARHNAAQA